MSNQLTPVQKLQTFVQERTPQLQKMLPAHIKPEVFERAAMNAIMRSPELAECEPKSVYDALMRCSQDGLIPDGKDAAIVIYGGKGKKSAQYQPMIDGVLKRVRQSGIVKNISAKAVYENDEFDYWFDEDGEHIKYRPTFGDRGQFKLVFGYAKLDSGEMVVEVMNKDEINKVKTASRAGNSQYSPWAQWFDRMAVKSVLHRLARRLPNSSEVSQILEVTERDIDARFDHARDVTPKENPGVDALLKSTVEPEPQAHPEPTADVDDVFGDNE